MKIRDRRMGILTGFAIIFVAMGHLNVNELSLWGLFPYYSFHVMVFVFVSGYFYRDPWGNVTSGIMIRPGLRSVMSYLGHKARRLLLPYFIWNLIYGIISTILSGRGFSYCQPMSLYNFFIEPWLGGHQFGLNFASWFVPALFLVETINLLCRTLWKTIIFKTKITDNMTNVIFAISTLAVGIATVYLAKGGHVWGLWKTPGRILLMLPVFEFGVLYRNGLEQYEQRIPIPAALAAACVIQGIMYALTQGRLNFGVVWCTSFAGPSFVPFVTSLCGIWFWMRISGLIDRRIDKAGTFLDGIGLSSFHIMMHHVTIFWVINLVTMLICNVTSPKVSFDVAAFMSDINYVYQLNGLYVWRYAYLIAGIAIPSLAALLIRRSSGSSQ